MARGSKGSAATSTRSRNTLTFDDVVEIGLTLPDTEESTAYGGRCLKINGRLFTGTPVHKSAEPNSIYIQCTFADRDAMLEEQPDIYYTAAHYEHYPCVLVRLSRINRELLKDLLLMSHRFVVEKHKGKKPLRNRKASRPSRRRR